jgi:putative DNA primase/helicase
MVDRRDKLIDFAGLAAALLDRAQTLVPQWLRGGIQRGHEWVCGDLYGNEGDSCSVNLVSGAWADFGGNDDERGGDLISLYAAIHSLGQREAALELMQQLGMARADGPPRRDVPAPAAPEAAAAAPPETSPAREASKWQPIVPVPAHAPAPRFRWGFKDRVSDVWVELEAVRSWEYAFEGERYGYVARFERIRASTGEVVKDTLPMTWCQDTTDPRGGCRWHWKAWDTPRPLYVPATLLSGDPRNVPVVVVEGEKCAEAGHQLLGHEFDFVSWPGGARSWAMARWGWLMGRTVYLWPDADAKRQRLTKAEREAGLSPEAKPLMPLAMQPGMKAMVGIGSVLVADQVCDVYMLPIGEPGTRPDGWDIADAIAEGWDAARVRDFIRSAGAFVPPDDAARAKARGPISTPSGAGAGQGGDAPKLDWRDKLLKSAAGATKAVRDNVVLAIDGQELADGEWLPGIEEAAGVIAFNEFTNDVIKLQDTPWGTPAGIWDEVDELEMGNWLTRVHWLPSMPRGTLEEAVAMVAKRHRFHPVRQEFEALRGQWDGEKRLATWLRRCCLEEDEFDDADQLQQYLARVGTWLLMAICARVMSPGCKFDYMVIFEGAQGMGKSTLARLLGGEFFADTGLVLGDKDSFQNLQGVLVYEWGELDSLTKAEVTKVKQFISSQKDRFRASFDRRAKDYPRQVVFVGTTNEDHYLVDPTGNRRFWPVRVTRQIDIDWVRAQRTQLFAEAMSYFEAGERYYPTTAEQRRLFEPQQQQRQIENAIQAAILRHLYDDTGTGENGTLLNEVTVPSLLSKLGVSVDKQTHPLLRQATAALRHAGWVRYRSSRADRPWMFRRPEGAGGLYPAGSGEPTDRPTRGHNPEGAEHGCPF